MRCPPPTPTNDANKALGGSECGSVRIQTVVLVPSWQDPTSAVPGSDGDGTMDGSTSSSGFPCNFSLAGGIEPHVASTPCLYSGIRVVPYHTSPPPGFGFTQ
jgi:hypothetical protein